MREFHCVQNLPIPVVQAWEFVSNPRNLKEIMPPNMGFDITSGHLPDKMYPGMIVSYKVRPILGIAFRWVTEITQVREPEYFVDEQRFGPYAFWHHKHFIRGIEGGVEMEDLVHFKVPGGKLGDLFTPLLVLPKLREIFAFRQRKLEELFGKFTETSNGI
ncbi:MAG: SRPBCC family protein [Opitutales bacterium]|nr:SRPBCC family protein [Opitutales bacterium]